MKGFAIGRQGRRRCGRLRAHRPEQTLLYQFVEEHYPTFAALRAAQGRPLPAYVQREFVDFLKCRSPGTRFSAGALRTLPRREAGRLRLQTARFMPKLRGAADGRKRGTGIEYPALLDYLSTDRRKSEIIGQFAGLLEAISESDTQYRDVHVIGYSFGSIIAIDAIFPTDQPTKRHKRIRSLITVGSPFDIVSFWPGYFRARKRAPGKLEWLNVFSPNDVLSSNSRNDDDAVAGTDFSLGPEDDLLKPRNLPYGAAGARRIRTLERFRQARRVHTHYWGDSNFAASFLNQVVPDIWAGNHALK